MTLFIVLVQGTNSANDHISTVVSVIGLALALALILHATLRRKK